MKLEAFSAGLLVVLAACGDFRPDNSAAAPDSVAAARDSARLRAAADSAALQDSATVQNERTGALAPVASGWTAGRTAVQLSGGSLATLLSVRQSRQEGFDRVVFDFGARSLPNYDVDYVDTPQHQCGSGEEVRLKGDAWLAIKLQPVQAHDDAGNATVQERSRAPGFPNLLELRLTCDFEGQVEWIAGVARPNGYRVMMLQQPNRLVVDIRH